MILAALFLPVIWKKREKFWNAKVAHVSYFFIVGGIGSALGTLSFTQAFTLLNPSLVILLQKFQPIVAIFLAHIVLKERVSKTFLFWAGLCLVGGLFISYEEMMPGLSKGNWTGQLMSSDGFRGLGLTFLAVIGWGAATVFGKRLVAEGFSGSEIMAGRFWAGFLCLLPFLATDQFQFDTDWRVWSKISLMVGLSGLLAMYLYYQGLKRIPAKLCALAEMFFPFCAVAVNWIFLGATLNWPQIAGALLLLLGSTVIQLKQY